MSIDLTLIPPLGTEPIPGDNPGGVNVQSDDDFDVLQHSFTILTSIEGGMGDGVKPAGEDATWEKVAETSIEILSQRSKNMRVCTFLVIALFYENGVCGLAVGMEVINNFLKNFWDTMYPPKKILKARASAMEYIATLIAGESDAPGGYLEIRGEEDLKEFRESIAQNPSQSALEAAYEDLCEKHEHLGNAKQTMEEIKKQIYELFPTDKLPVITSLRDTISSLHINFGEEVKKHKPREAPPAGEGSSEAASPDATPAAASASSMPAVSSGSPEEVRKSLIRLAPVLREADPTDAAAYRLIRMGVWGAITAAPPTKEGNVTRVPPGSVTKQIIESAETLLSASNWLNLLNSAEARFPASPLWLDQQYHVFKALKGMGPAFEGASRAVMDELAGFLRRVPGIADLAFDGGTPFADDRTRSWIDDEVMAESEGGGGGGKSSGGDSTSAELEAAIEEARKLAGDGKLAAGMSRLQGGPSGSTSQRDRFIWRIAMAQLAQESGKKKLTQPIWESLMAEIERFTVDEWDPEVCVPVFSALYRIYKSDKTAADKAAEIYGRLSRADIGAAVALEK